MKTIKRKMMLASAGIFMGLILGVEEAFAKAKGGSGDGLGAITDNVQTSISGLPGVLSGVSYMMGILLGTLGILKIKDHVENPGNSPLRQGVVRLGAGGGLLALPIVYQAMQESIGTDGTLTDVNLDAIDFGTN